MFHSYTGWVWHLVWKNRLRTITALHGMEPIEFEALTEEFRRQGKTLSWRYRPTYGPLMNAMLQRTCRGSDRVLCLNSAEADLLVDRGWTTADRITVGTHGVPPEGFVPDRVHRPQARRVVLVSQWIDRKGVRYIADAFTTLIREGLDLELLYQVIRDGAGNSRMFEVRGPLMIKGVRAFVDQDRIHLVHDGLPGLRPPRPGDPRGAAARLRPRRHRHARLLRERRMLSGARPVEASPEVTNAELAGRS